MKSRIILLIALLAAAACGPASEPRPRGPAPAGLAPTEQELADAAQDFDEVRSGYLEWYFEAHPVRATELGVHDHDGRLPAMTRTGIQRRIDSLLEWLSDLEQIRFDFMRDGDRYDYAVLEYGIRSELLELEETRTWANDPGVYTDVIARGLSELVEREFAPAEQRLRSLRSRMMEAPSVLRAARQNVRQPPRIWTELALADTRGLLEYLERDLPAMLSSSETGPVGAVDTARQELVSAVEEHLGWLARDLLPRSTGTFRLGRYLLERKLLYGEHVSLSLEELQRLNTNAINEYRAQVAEVVERIDPDRSPREVMDSISRVGPSPEELLDRARAAVAATRDWVESSGVVEIPREGLPAVRESPPWARTAFVSLDAPGPFDSGELRAFLNLTNVREEWDEALVREHMSFFSDAGLAVTALHAAFPGEYVQRQYARDLPELRRVLATGASTAGWAHYAAEMAVEEGFSDDPAVRLEQLRRALQRHARWYAVIRLHALDEPLNQVVAAFMEIAYFDEFPARREVLRATRDPGIMADALGRMQIKELRDDYRSRLEEQADTTFALAEFHGRLLRLGLPYTLAREVLIPADRRRTDSR